MICIMEVLKIYLDKVLRNNTKYPNVVDVNVDLP